MDYRKEYERWLANTDGDILDALKAMDDTAIEDAFYRDLAFGTGGLRGIIGAGTNRMNVYVVARASQGLANHLGAGASVVIGYDSRIKSDVFARTAAAVFAANGIAVHFWPQLLPVPTVSYATRALHASAGVMITASHNPSRYNGYKVYGSDGCQITTAAAAAVLAEIEKLDLFADVKRADFDEAVAAGQIKFIDPSVLTAFIEEVKQQSVLFGDEVDPDVAIVYSPLNGTGLVPVTRVLQERGFTNITVVEEQRAPDGHFPTCPYPNPEIREAMALGLQYCERTGADLLLATDPDCDRCGIAVKGPNGYQLLTGNEVGLLLLDFICNQRLSHDRMPENPTFVKTIVTTDLAEKIADHYGVKTINVLTGFKFIGEVIGAMPDPRDYILGFEESYGYLTGTYVRDKDGVNAALMICEMFAYYKTRGISLLERLDALYAQFGYCLNTLHTREFPGSNGMRRMAEIMAAFRSYEDSESCDDNELKIQTIGDQRIVRVDDYAPGLNGLPKADVLKYGFEGKGTHGSIVIRPSGTEPKLKLYISVTAPDRAMAEALESRIAGDLEARL